MRVLVTRPEPAAARTAARLRAGGHLPLLAPLLTINPLAHTWPMGRIDALVATSAAPFDVPRATPPTPEVRRLLPLFLVGARTAEAASAAGFEGPATVCADSQALVAALWTRPDRHRLLYLAGHDRKAHVETALADTRTLLVVEAYVAEAAQTLPDIAERELYGGRIDAVLHYSARTAAVFLDLIGPNQAAALAHFCLSPDAAGPLIAANLPHVQAAARPDEASLFALLEANN
jgi:uroporphyrinogen-III synthase